MGTWNLATYDNKNEKQPIYIGCIGVRTSMRTLHHVIRSEVAKESINRLCRAKGIIRTPDKKRADHIKCMLDDEPNLQHSGMAVQLDVTNTHLNVVSKDTKEILIQHEMPNVSFASSGDEETADFVAYVAKNSKFGRACFVLECYESANTILENIAHGFQLRTEQIFYKTISRNNNPFHQNRLSNSFLQSPDSHNALEASNMCNIDNQSSEKVIAATRSALEREPWYHGSYLSREESETRLKNDGDFLVRESMLDPGHFVLSVMHAGMKLHLLFDSMKIGIVKTKEKEFPDISNMIKYHLDEGYPIVFLGRTMFLRNGVRPR